MPRTPTSWNAVKAKFAESRLAEIQLPKTLRHQGRRTPPEPLLHRMGFLPPSCPNRHMHSPNESVDLEDLENCARLISAYVKTLDADSDFIR